MFSRGQRHFGLCGIRICENPYARPELHHCATGGDFILFCVVLQKVFRIYCCYDYGAVRVSDNVLPFQANAFRTLRFLFSMERNRRHFKRLFPVPRLFEIFIDIGHYNKDINAYRKLVDSVNTLTVCAICYSLVGNRGHPWYSGSTPDCWSTGRVIDPVLGA